MAGGLFSMEHPWASAFGIMGNIVSFLVFLAPTPTFLRVYRKKSTEGFSSVPYVVALFSCALWIFYALVKTNSSPLLTTNSFGCVVEAAYILLYIIYAPRAARLRTLAAFFLLNVAAFSLVVVVTLMLVAEPHRVKVLGSVCLAFSMAVFVAPMSVIFVVIRTKSAEFMPFSLSFFLTLSAVAGSSTASSPRTSTSRFRTWAASSSAAPRWCSTSATASPRPPRCCRRRRPPWRRRRKRWSCPSSAPSTRWPCCRSARSQCWPSCRRWSRRWGRRGRAAPRPSDRPVVPVARPA